MALELGSTQIDSYLPNNLRREYHGKIPPWQRIWVAQSLDSVARWGLNDPKQYSDTKHLPMKPGFIETNLGHTLGMLEMINEAEGLVHLRGSLDFRAIRIMAILHDLGEFRIGDAPHSGEEREKPKWKARKRFEPSVVRNVIAWIKDRDFREEVEAFYNRYEEQAPGDSEALFVKFLDKSQGTSRTGVEFIFDWHSEGFDAPNMRLIDHVGESLRKMSETGIPFLESLKGNAQMDAGKFVIGEFRRLNRIGFSELVTPHIRTIRSLLAFS